MYLPNWCLNIILQKAITGLGTCTLYSRSNNFKYLKSSFMTLSNHQFFYPTMNSLRFARAAVRIHPSFTRIPMQRRGYADAVSDKLKLTLTLPHQVLNPLDCPHGQNYQHSSLIGYYSCINGNLVDLQIPGCVCPPLFREDYLVVQLLCSAKLPPASKSIYRPSLGRWASLQIMCLLLSN